MTEQIILAAIGVVATLILQRIGGIPSPSPTPKIPVPVAPAPDTELVAAHRWLVTAKAGGVIVDDLDREVIKAIKPLVDDFVK